jgi:hypothetical protein
LHEPTENFTIESGPTFDRLGHVNNCRYGEFAYDAFTDEERQNLTRLGIKMLFGICFAGIPQGFLRPKE